MTAKRDLPLWNWSHDIWGRQRNKIKGTLAEVDPVGPDSPKLRQDSHLPDSD